MTIPYLQVLEALRRNRTDQLRELIKLLPIAEAVELGTFGGPVRLAAITLQVAATTAFHPQDTPRDTAGLLAEISRQAFNAPIRVAQAITPDRVTASAITAALLDVAQRRTVAPLLSMTDDVTATLPTATGTPPSLSEADYADAAQRNRIEVAAIKAVASVESGGRSGFDQQGRPKILFEAHHFGPLSGNRFIRTHPHLACAAGNLAHAHRFYG